MKNEPDVLRASGMRPNTTTPSIPGESRHILSRVARFRELGIIIAIVVMAALIESRTNSFLGVYNISTMLVQFAMFGILAIGETFVILTAGIDLSVGAITAFSAVFSAMMVVNFHFPTVLAIVLILVIGAVIGLVHALFIVRAGITPFIVTLASMSIFEGLTLYITQGFPVTNLPASYLWLGSSTMLGIPTPFWLLALYFGLVWVIIYRTPLGRHVFAVGGNAQAARLSGVRVDRVVTFVYVVSAVSASLVGVVLAGWLGEGQPGAASGWELQAIAATIIGGTSLFGGVGSLLGALLGAVFMSTLSDGMVLLNISSYLQQLVLGIVILVAVVFAMWQTRRLKASGRR